MNGIDKIRTGVPGLDVITHGGIPARRTTLVTGRSGAGKSVLALQVAANLARGGATAVYVTFEERPEDLAATGDGLGFGVSDLVSRGKMRLMDLRRPAGASVQVSGDYDAGGLVERVGAAVSEAGAGLVVLDSALSLFHPRPPEATARGHFFDLVTGLEDMGLTVIVTAEAPGDYGRTTLLGIEDYVCDLVLCVRNVVDGKRRRRSIEVHKYRRSGHNKGEYPFTITDQGVTVFPLDAAEDPHPRSSLERFSSGLPGLDEMNSGGWLRDSIVIVRGPSGSGKTLLAGMYARAGAARNERVVYYGFEETRGILVRNFAEIGLEMDPFLASGNLRVVCRFPEATSNEDLLIEIRRDLIDFDPSLIVLDSISSIEHSTSDDAFRIFLIGLASLIRSHGRSALLTQTIASHAEASQDPPFLSTVADAILMLDYSADEQDLRRTMRVLKMRGSAHATEKRALFIEAGGLRVERFPAGGA